MPWGLERWHGGHDLHFITFSCYGRQPLLATAQRRDLFLEVLERVRRRYSWVVLAYVVMPEHVHLLVSEPAERPLSTAIQALKLGFARYPESWSRAPAGRLLFSNSPKYHEDPWGICGHDCRPESANHERITIA